MSKKIESTVILKCKPDKIEEFKIVVKQLIAKTVKEPGCELFRIFQNKEKADEFVLWEIFKDEKAMEIHMNAEYTQACFALGLFEPVIVIHQNENL